MSAGPRIPFAEPASDEAGRAAEAAILASRGTIVALYQVLLNSPAMAKGWEALLTAVRQKSSLPPRLREMIILRIAVLNRAPYEFQSHLPIALAEGMSEAEVEALRAGEFGALAAFERTALAATDALTRDVTLPQALFDALATKLDKRGLVDLLVTISAYNMVSRFLAGAGLD